MPAERSPVDRLDARALFIGCLDRCKTGYRQKQSSRFDQSILQIGDQPSF